MIWKIISVTKMKRSKAVFVEGLGTLQLQKVLTCAFQGMINYGDIMTSLCCSDPFTAKAIYFK